MTINKISKPRSKSRGFFVRIIYLLKNFKSVIFERKINNIMAITSDSVKIKFNIGSFDVDTTLDIPEKPLKNKFFLGIEKEIGAQIPNWDDSFNIITTLLKITFEGQVLYKNAQFDDAVFSVAPTDPDITIDQDTGGADPQTVTALRNFHMVLDSDGAVANGRYTIESKFVYFGLSPAAYTVESITTIANLTYDRKQPILSEWYDQGIPTMSVTDAQSYVIGSVNATVNNEFVLSPPQNRTERTNTFTDIQNITYGSFWTGGNEMTYTARLDYNFTTYDIVTVEQKYDSFVIYYMDWCATYDCLNELYELATGGNCSVKQKGLYNDRWLKATSIIQQIQLGLGCGKETLSRLIEELNDVLDCECGCLDETPRLISSTNTIDAGDVQYIDALTANTVIDPTKGKVVFVNLDIGGNTTEIDITDIEKYGQYRFMLKNTSQDPTMTATFTTKFQGSAGAMASVAVANGKTVIVDFFAISDTVLQLVSRSDA